MPKMNAIDPIEFVGDAAVTTRSGRNTEILTVVDDDSTDMTLAAADILAGINVHTSAVAVEQLRQIPQRTSSLTYLWARTTSPLPVITSTTVTRPVRLLGEQG